jgi:ornithine carbamoyltransferase
MPATPPHASAAADRSPLDGLVGGDLLSSADLTPEQTRALLSLAADLKAGRRRIDLGGKLLGLIFSKASTRTRVSFTVAMARLGGQTIDLLPIVTQVGRGEPLADTARVLSRYCDALAIRTFAQADLEAYAHWATIPVINALTDLEHPCQALADFHTLQEAFGSSPADLAGLTLAYVGDGNNVAHSLMLCGALLGVNVRIGCPEGFAPDPAVLERARALANGGAQISVVHDPLEAARGAQALEDFPGFESITKRPLWNSFTISSSRLWSSPSFAFDDTGTSVSVTSFPGIRYSRSCSTEGMPGGRVR